MEKRKIIVFKDGKYKKYLYTEEQFKKIKSAMKSVCFDCNCVFNGGCPKVSDSIKKPFYLYPFVESGYQIISEDGAFKEITVSKCNNRVVDTPENLLQSRIELKDRIEGKAIRELCGGELGTVKFVRKKQKNKAHGYVI